MSDEDAQRGGDTPRIHEASKDPLISVITVVFNGAAGIEATLRSVFSQDPSLYEVVVIDGGSTDGTLAILDRYRDRLAVCISEPDRGIYDAMNKAVLHARGRWIYFLGSDDILRDCLNAVSLRLKDPEAIYYGDVYRTGTGIIYGGRFNAWRLERSNICHQAIFYPRSVFLRYQYNIRYPLLADWELNLRCCGDKSLHFEHLPILVADYNDATGKSSIASDGNFAADQAHIIRECLPRPQYLWHMLKRLIHRAVDGIMEQESARPQ